MIGDVLTTSALFEVLRKEIPNSELHYLINSNTQPVVENNPHINQLLIFTPKMEKSKAQRYSFLKNVRSEKYDVVIDVYGKLGSNLISKFSGAKKRIGYFKNYTSFLYTHNVQRLAKPLQQASLAIENRMRLLEPLNIEFQNVRPKIYLTEEEILYAKSMLDENKIDSKKPLYMISVLGSKPKKTYPLAYMAELLDIMAMKQPDAQILFNYIPNQLKEAQEIYDACSATTQSRIYFDLFGKSLREFLALTSQCDALIGNEGGAVNMAKALNIPTFMIFSPSMPKSHWFGEVENNQNVAVHLSDYIAYEPGDQKNAKRDTAPYYSKFKPGFIEPKLISFLAQLDKEPG